MKHTILTAALVVSLGMAAPLFAGEAVSKAEVKAERQRIEAQTKAAREKCNALSGSAKSICTAEAKGQESIAKAELEARVKGTPKAHYDVRVAKAEMVYDVARERCGERVGKARGHCLKEARAAYDQARTEAKTEREAAEKRKT
jgi:hypothetical protein